MSFFQILKYIPQLISLVRAIMSFIKKQQDEKEARDRQKAIDKLQEAKTEQEIKDAAKDYLSKG